ncbi:MAG: hypothetical protein KF745_13450 [Phycisphaeraceae bacterium]|nr:hypothetical protein [Phycisphaeraceae bacterium]
MTTSIDERIRKALESDAMVEPDLRDMIGDVIGRRTHWLNILSMLWTVVFLVLGVYCAVRFFGTDDLVLVVRWGVGVLLCTGAVSLLKMWFLMIINRNTILREVKRLELRLAASDRGASA